MKKYALTVLAVVGSVLTAPVVTATPAQAGSYRDCSYPYVCLYSGSYSSGSKLVQYQDALYQNLASNRQNQADSVVNTRNDDSVWLLDTGASPDRYLCIPANGRVNLGDYAHPNGGTWANDVDTIRIWGDPDNGRCNNTTSPSQGSVPDGWRG